MFKEKRCPWGHIIHWLGIGAGVVAGLFLSGKIVSVQPVKAATIYVDPKMHISYQSSTWTKNGKTIKDNGYWGTRVGNASGPVAFCIQLGTPLGQTGGISGYKQYTQSGTLPQKISAIAYFGYQKQKSLKNQMATNYMIWEALGGKPKSMGGTLSMSQYNTFKKNVNAKVDSVLGKPSFQGKSINLKPGQSVTVTDTTGRFAGFKASPYTNTANVSAKKNGNKLTITATANSKDGTIGYVPNIDSNYQGTPIYFTHPTKQNVIRPLLDPISNLTSLKITVTKNVIIRLQKYDVSTDPGKNDPLAGVTFHFTKDGKSYGDFTTDAKGQISLNKSVSEMAGNWTSQETKTVNGFKLDSTIKKFSVASTDAGKTINLTATNERVPETIHTTATSEDGTHIQEPHKQATITDRVQYENAVIGKKYTVTGVLMDKDTREALLDDNGNKVTKSVSFTAKTTSGYIDVPFTFDAHLLAGKTVVAFETLSRDGREVAVHNDIEDEGQTIIFSTPKMGTTATDLDGSHDVLPDADLTINNVVAYHDLIVGKTYTIKGQLIDKATGKVVLDAKGNPITAEKTFVADKADGSVTMTYTVDASKAMGKEFVVFEDLYRDNNLIVSHADINDEGQTVKVVTPKVHTTATSDEGDKQVMPEADVTIKDAVAYSDLVVGKHYSVTGYLHYTDGSFVLDAKGNKIAKTVSFTAEKTDGTIDVTFTVDGRLLAGKDVVVFENLYHNYNLMAFHENVNDKNQTVHFPKIELHTTATDSEGSKEVVPEERVTVKDAVAYHDLIVGKTYTVTGYLHYTDGSFVKNADGSKVSKTVTFKAEKADGTIDVEFVVDGRALAGKDVVAFEYLYHNGKLIASHEDINDKDQTVHFPKIELHTTATSDGKKTVTASQNMTINDVVEFNDLVIGKTYTVKGYLMDKATGKPVLINGKKVTAEKTFKATAKDMKVTMTFTFDGSSLGGHDVVAFEDLYHDGKLIASHADINDAGQTVHIASAPKLTQTDDSLNGALLALGVVALISAAGIAFYLLRKRA
ncbi:VaFE repeat-containing surface-anchored protein [Lacticaseibacillus suibinensis]|uniref:VaFE repeat-containing surface-anchored protein n=1 Tax=Lacticaseibacillus suibinensis TaxID=2486011 RepID=UPI0019433FA8|nr:VaFE repeat-containing surface-anchored protein [Lacticaseibacillus suibinensis]